MAVLEVLAAVADQWDRIDGLLDTDDRTALHELIIELDTVDQDDQRRRDLQSAIASLVLRNLSKDDPIRALRFDRLSSGADTRLNPATLAVALRAKVSGHGSPSAKLRILGSPWEAATDLRGRGIDPDLPDLIRLDHDGRYAVPSFQFDPTGTAIPVVLRVNQVLGAWADPWGAAHWWLTANVWLTERPSDLINGAEPDLLVAAATAAVEG